MIKSRGLSTRLTIDDRQRDALTLAIGGDQADIRAMTEPDYTRLSTLSTGLRCRCPRCGKGPLLRGYLKIRDACPACGLDYSFADPADGPAFFGMTAVGTVGLGLFMWFEFTVQPPIWVHFVVTMPLLVIACLGVLRPIKGWMVSEQYVHKAAPPEWASIGKHGDGDRWR